MLKIQYHQRTGDRFCYLGYFPAYTCNEYHKCPEFEQDLFAG